MLLQKASHGLIIRREDAVTAVVLEIGDGLAGQLAVGGLDWGVQSGLAVKPVDRLYRPRRQIFTAPVGPGVG